ncbi:MAG TPA: flagellar hook protein FlgE [bacterium]|jgi:flagellar hook protein FlgE
MSILSSLFVGISGLNTNGNAMSVIGDNIANVNTIGFKASSATFEDLLGASIGSEQALGAGTALSGIAFDLSQGSFETTGGATDLAVDGRGFFMVRKDGSDSFTRAGRFHFDKDGVLVNTAGYAVRGFAADEMGNIASGLSDIVIEHNAPPQATTTATIGANLDSRVTAPPAFDINDTTNTSNFSTTLTVYDTLGNDHFLTFFFRKASSLNWEWYAAVDKTEITNPLPTDTTLTQVGSGTLAFTGDGALFDETTTTPISVTWNDLTIPHTIASDFGTNINSEGSVTGLDGTTQFGSPSNVAAQTQDGFGAGVLLNIGINDNGDIEGAFSNGGTRVIGRIALATFANDGGLRRLGGNLFIETTASGQPLVGSPDTGGRGLISSAALEKSNVDLATEFVNMIQVQRGYQANTRTIRTTDQMLVDLISLIQ